jgi:pyruvate formate lyase activating enzyme
MPNRRDFLRTAALAAPCLLAAPRLGEAGRRLEPPSILQWGASDLATAAPKARYWVPASAASAAGADCGSCHLVAGALDARHRHASKAVACQLCARGCLIRAGERGDCRARINVNGELRSLVYGRPMAINLDPIEKKPFFHFLPGTTAYSIGTAGCPLHCKFCQNWQLSQVKPDDYDVPYTGPVDIVATARRREAASVAFTYNEPTVFIEYMLDTAAVARKQGLRTALVSCGFMNERPLADMCAALDAIKIDLKGYSEDFYRTVSGASLAPVLRSIRQVRKSGTHLEIVNLVVPTLNDAEASLRGLADFVMGELGPDVPVHFTRFHPDYQLLNLPPTPIATLDRARSLAMDRGLRYVYVGNVPGHPGNHTYCPGCGKVVIRRDNFFVVENNVKNGHCAFCGRVIAGVWQ